MHPECPDYDLCERCEAFPIALHPSNHPLLKMKTPETVIPTVYRVGQTCVIQPTTVDNERQTLIDTPPFGSSSSANAYRVPPPPSVLSPPSVLCPPSVPLPVPPTHAHPSSVAEDDMRSSTPIARSFSNHVVSEKGEAHPNQNRVEKSPESLASITGPPKLPPKPDMISHSSWASIPDIFRPVPINTRVLFPDQNVGSSQFFFGTIQPPQGTQPTIPAIPPPPPLHVLESLPAPRTPEDNVRRNVPNHNPWPTTNATEKEELLKLIAEFSGSASVRSSVPVPPVSFNNFPNQSAATPTKNNPFLTPPAAAVELPTTSTVEQPTFDFQAWRPSVKDPLPSWASLTPDVIVQEGLEHPTELKPASEPVSVVGSPLSGQALLNRPTSSGSTPSSSHPRSLAELIHQLPSLIPPKILSLEKLPESTGDRETLSAKFVDDVTVPDGQAFPPGAEFVKCWRLLNTSERDWPEDTELVFVAGDPLSDSSLPPVVIGQVAAGAEFDVWTGELKVCLPTLLSAEH